MVRKLLMHAVPRMRLCSSLSVVAHLFCWLVCFFQRGVGFAQAMSLSTPCEKFEFLANISQVKIRNHESWRTWVSVWVSGCAGVRRLGVLVSGCLFFVHTCLPLPACLPALGASLPALGACWPRVPADIGCLPAFGACLPWVPAGLGCLHAYLDQTEFVVIFLSSSVGVDSVAQRTRVGSRIGHSHSEMEGSRPAAPALSRDSRWRRAPSWKFDKGQTLRQFLLLGSFEC